MKQNSKIVNKKQANLLKLVNCENYHFYSNPLMLASSSLILYYIIFNNFSFSYITDATAAMFISFLLFVFPSQPPNFLCLRKKFGELKCMMCSVTSWQARNYDLCLPTMRACALKMASNQEPIDQQWFLNSKPFANKSLVPSMY